ncbi:hypothetical protein TNIN_329351 [Trichonephila inaurata madagascariensis]|uniref:Uncharacterized protein n=1 Tax=Trichonephila inaurata madagascariensis TaxID=2747483 RepID=A0A8X6WLX4_9ARAC|nr:hypothetical protein TNIN_329351 [Trichonephila inaurata madagascariensis]
MNRSVGWCLVQGYKALQHFSSYSTVKNWYNECNRGRRSIHDEFRVRCPKPVVVPETTNAVCKLIKQDLHVSYREIDVSLDIRR